MPEASHQGLREREDRSRPGSHAAPRPGGLVSSSRGEIRHTEPSGKPWLRLPARTHPAASPTITRDHSSPSGEVASAQRAQPTPQAQLVSMATRRLAQRQLRRNNPAAPTAFRAPGASRPPGPAPFTCYRGNEPCSTHCVCAGTGSTPALPSSMADSQVPHPQSSPSEENGVTQQHRPSVTWNLSSPKVNAAATKTSTSSGTYPASAVFRRHRLGSRPEINLGSQPQTCFLQPRTSKPMVLFRCGPGAQSVRQTPGRLGKPDALGPPLPQLAPETRSGPPRAWIPHTPGTSSFPVQLFEAPGARIPSAQTRGGNTNPTSAQTHRSVRAL